MTAQLDSVEDLPFYRTHIYALPGSRVYHRAVSASEHDRPHLACIPRRRIHDLMSTALTIGVGRNENTYRQRRCKRCFP